MSAPLNVAAQPQHCLSGMTKSRLLKRCMPRRSRPTAFSSQENPLFRGNFHWSRRHTDEAARITAAHGRRCPQAIDFRLRDAENHWEWWIDRGDRGKLHRTECAPLFLRAPGDLQP